MVRSLPWKSLVVAALALVGSSASASTRLVINASEVDDEATLSAVRAGLGADLAADVLDLGRLLDPDSGPWRVTYPGTLETCGAGRASLAQLEEDLARAEEQMTDLEYGEAQVLLEDLDGRLCGADQPLPADMVSRVPYLLGVVLAYRGEPDRARDHFTRAVEREPELSWDNDFPPDPQQLFLSAATEAVRGKSASFTLDPAATPAEVWIDGKPLPASGAPATLLGRRHLLQIRGGDGQISTATLIVDDLGTVTLVHDDRTVEGAARTPTDPLGALAFGALASVAIGRGYTEVLLVQDDTPDHLWRFDPADREWSLVSLVRDELVARARGFQAAGSALMGSGLAVSVAGGVIAGTSARRGKEVLGEMTGPNGELSAGLYDLHVDEYDGYRRDTIAGWVMMGAGVAVAAIGVPLLIRGAHEGRAARSGVAVGAWVTPGGGAVAIGGRF